MSTLPPPNRLCVTLTLAVMVLTAGGAVRGWGAERSPFEPAGTATAPVAVVASPLDRFEFRGVMTIGEDTFVTLVDTSTSKSMTIALGETIEGVKVSGFKVDDGSIQLEASGQSKRLKLREAKIVALAVPPPAPPPAPGAPPVQVAGNGPPVPGATMSDEEARTRMQRVAEEIRRRREMRRQMLEGQQGGGQPTN